MFRRAGTSSLLTAQSYGRCPRALTIPQVQVLNGVRRGRQAPHCGDKGRHRDLLCPVVPPTRHHRMAAPSPALLTLLPAVLRGLQAPGTADGPHFPRQLLALPVRAEARRMAHRVRNAGFHRGRVCGKTARTSCGNPSRPSITMVKTASQGTAARVSPGLRPGGANGLRTRTVSRTCPSCKSSVNRIRQALAWAAATMSESHHEIRKRS